MRGWRERIQTRARFAALLKRSLARLVSPALMVSLSILANTLLLAKGAWLLSCLLGWLARNHSSCSLGAAFL